MKKSGTIFFLFILVLSVIAISFIFADNSFISINYSSNVSGQDDIMNITFNNNPGINFTQINITTPFALGSFTHYNLVASVDQEFHAIYLTNLSSPSIIAKGASNFYAINFTNPAQTGTYIVNISMLDVNGNINFTSSYLTISGTSAVVNTTINQTLPHPTSSGNNLESAAINQIKITQALSQEVVCRINFNIGVINEFASQFPNASSNLQTSLTTLQNDLSQVQSFGNATEVQSFVKGQYSEDIKNAQSSIPTQEVRGTSLVKRAALVSTYGQLMATYQQCEKTNYMNIIQERINGYQIQIANFQNKTDILATKGFDVTSLNQLLQNAQTQIITPLQNSISNSSTIQQVQTAVMSYCLFDGCTNGTNFHLDANFDVTRLNIILSNLQNNATAFNLDSSTISQAQQYLSDAQSTLNTVGTSAYQKGQAQTIFSDIQNASKIIVQLITQALKQPIGGLK